MKVRTKGTKILYGIAGALVPIAQQESIDLSGFKTKTTDLTDLETDEYEEKGSVGLAEPGTVKSSGFFDPALAGHTALLEDIPDPPADSTVQIEYATTPVKAHSFNVAGIDFSIKVAKADYLKGDFNFETSGTPNWAATVAEEE